MFLVIFISVFLAIIAILLFIGYLIARRFIGEKAACQNILFGASCMVFGAIICTPFLLYKNGYHDLVLFQGIFALLGTIFLLFYHFKSRSYMGTLVKTFSSGIQNKIVLWSGVAQIIIQGLILVLDLPFLSSNSSSLVIYSRQHGTNVLLFFLGVYFTYFGSRKNQVYENGIFIMGIFVMWEKISEYKFEAIRQNTFRANYKNDVPFIPGIINLAFSDNDKTDFIQILQSKLPNLEPKS
jgi:Domain of unknown function (DUF5673)